MSHRVAVVERRKAAGSLLNPIRRRVLELLQAEPGSATSLAKTLNLPRQKVNYHVRALEDAGLVEPAGTRQRHGLQERLVRATATHYLISPDVAGQLSTDPAHVTDRFSSTYQIAIAARTIREVARLADGARAAGKPLATLTLDTEVRFATAADRQAFAEALVNAVGDLVARYHDATSPGGRTYRLFLGSHPLAAARPSPDANAAPPRRTRS